MRNCNGGEAHPEIRDQGPQPFVVNINHAAAMNQNFRTTLWTGDHLQLTLMSIPVGGEIGAEMHPHVDQFIRVESGFGKVCTGGNRCDLCETACVDENDAILIPAGTWHNVIQPMRSL